MKNSFLLKEAKNITKQKKRTKNARSAHTGQDHFKLLFSHHFISLSTGFKTNMSAIDYAMLIRKKQPIGSGAIESAVRRIVNLRIKGAGTFWKLENAEAALHLRCQLKTNNWSRFYADFLNHLAA